MSAEQDLISKEVERIVERGENAHSQDESKEIKVKLNDYDITEELMKWFSEHRARTISSIYDFIDFLEEFLEKRNRARKEEEKLKKRISKSHKDYRRFVENRQKYINKLVKEEEERMKDEWFPPELDAFLMGELIYARKKMLKHAKEAHKALQDILINQRRIDRKVKEKTYELVKNVVFAMLLIDLRILEILLFSKRQANLRLSLDLMEWDLNTLEFATYQLSEYTHSLFKQVIARQWDPEFHEETVELLRIFGGG